MSFAVHINLSHEQNPIDSLLFHLFHVPPTTSAISCTEIKCLRNTVVKLWINLLAGHFPCNRDTWMTRIARRFWQFQWG